MYFPVDCHCTCENLSLCAYFISLWSTWKGATSLLHWISLSPFFLSVVFFSASLSLSLWGFLVLFVRSFLYCLYRVWTWVSGHDSSDLQTNSNCLHHKLILVVVLVPTSWAKLLQKPYATLVQVTSYSFAIAFVCCLIFGFKFVLL